MAMTCWDRAHPSCKILVFLAVAGTVAAQDMGTRLLSQARADLAEGQYAAAVTKGSKAAVLFRKAGDRAREERALTGVGLAQLYSGEYPAAIDSVMHALNIARQIHDPENEVTLLNNLGAVFCFQGRYGEAFDRYQEALRITEKLPNEKWTVSRRQLTVANLATLYQTLGQCERALDLYSQLLSSPQALSAREKAQLLANVGSLRRRLGAPQKALETYRAAQAMYKKSALRHGEIGVLNNIGIVDAIDFHDFEGAIAAFNAALALAEESGARPLTVLARLYRGEALFRAGRMDQSASDFRAAADLAEALGAKEEHWKALYGQARIAAKHGDSVTANRLLISAVGLIESLRASLGGPGLRSEFLADKRDVYDLLIENTPGADDLFRLMERSRARNLQDRVSPTSVPDLSRLARRVPLDTVILEYWLGATSAAVLWISRVGIGVRRWQLAADDLEAIAAVPPVLSNPHRDDWLQAAELVARKLLTDLPPLEDPRVRHLVIVPDGALAGLPFEALPSSASCLLSRSHTTGGDGRSTLCSKVRTAGRALLIERFTVEYLPYASLFTGTDQRRKIRWPWQKTIEAFADPSPGHGDPGGELATPQAWPRLPEAKREVIGIARILGGDAVLRIGPDAQKKFIERVAGTPVLHLATHSFSDTQNPDQSYILLAPASQSQSFDYLFLKQVYGLSLAGVNLATISACKTDAGKLIRGEGSASFSRAFLSAGAQAVVTSLWNVGDRTTAETMLHFYTRLAAGDSKSEALRAAKLERLLSRGESHPANWAAFVLNGDGRSPLPYVIPWTWLAESFLALACLVLGFKVMARRALQSPHFRLHKARESERLMLRLLPLRLLRLRSFPRVTRQDRPSRALPKGESPSS
jgi:CHAT domain-containing protein/tetratricopeptide (TPR) repeat protein